MAMGLAPFLTGGGGVGRRANKFAGIQGRYAFFFDSSK